MNAAIHNPVGTVRAAPVNPSVEPVEATAHLTRDALLAVLDGARLSAADPLAKLAKLTYELGGARRMNEAQALLEQWSGTATALRDGCIRVASRLFRSAIYEADVVVEPKVKASLDLLAAASKLDRLHGVVSRSVLGSGHGWDSMNAAEKELLTQNHIEPAAANHAAEVAVEKLGGIDGVIALLVEKANGDIEAATTWLATRD